MAEIPHTAHASEQEARDVAEDAGFLLGGVSGVRVIGH